MADKQFGQMTVNAEGVIHHARNQPRDYGIRIIKSTWPGITDEIADDLLNGTISFINEANGTLHISKERA
jgi:hypothetical protein